jgi:hypothetical protein
MGLFRETGKVSAHDIEAAEGLKPLFDSVFSHLIERAYKGALDVYFAPVPRQLIRPFDVEYDPCAHPAGRAAIEAVMAQWAKGQFQYVWVYQQGDEFVLSDDYIVWEAAKRGRPDCLPCWILGKPLHAQVGDVQGPIDPKEVPRLLGFA